MKEIFRKVFNLVRPRLTNIIPADHQQNEWTTKIFKFVVVDEIADGTTGGIHQSI